MQTTPTIKFKTVDEYISTFPKNIRDILEDLRKTIKLAAPEVEELISYNMPAFKFYGILVYYAAYKNHIGFYPTNSGIQAFKEEISKYKNSKGTVQFPIDKSLPLELIRNIVKFRVQENLEKARMRAKKEKLI